MLVIGVFQVPDLLLSAPFLAIDDIVVRGHDATLESEVLALVEPLRGQNILAADLDLYRRRLVMSPRLRGGALRRVLPSTIQVFVIERIPVAVARGAERLHVIDESGRVIDEYGPRFTRFSLPLIYGLFSGGAGPPVTDPVRMALANRFLRQVAPHPDVLDSVSQIDVGDPYDAVVMLNDDPVLLHLGEDQFLDRLRSYAELAPALRQRVADIDYVDLRFEQRVYVGPSGLSTRSSAARSDRPAVNE